MKKILHDCIVEAILEIGIENFKKTSLFASNEKKEIRLEEAA